MLRRLKFWRVALLAGLAWGCESGTTEYRIHGDLGDVVQDGEVVLTQYTALLSEREEFAAAPIDGGMFELRGDTWAPRFVTLKVLVDGQTDQTIDLIVEPGEDVRVSHGDWVSGLSAEGGPYHQRLISSWETSPEYLEALENYRDIMTRKRALEDAGIYATGAVEGEDSLLDRAWAGWEALQAIKEETLDAWVRQREDPLASYLALELGGRDETTTVLATLDALEPLLPDEVVRRQLLPMRLRSEAMDRIADNVDGFALGERVTDFAVPDLDGNPVRLYDLLAENELVLIDFWAAWCAPCLAQFSAPQGASRRVPRPRLRDPRVLSGRRGTGLAGHQRGIRAAVARRERSAGAVEPDHDPLRRHHPAVQLPARLRWAGARQAVDARRSRSGNCGAAVVRIWPASVTDCAIACR